MLDNEHVKEYHGYKNLDDSLQLSDLSVIKEQEITEARIYEDGKYYYTMDREVIKNIVDRISNLHLSASDEQETETVYGFEELYLLNGDKVVYRIVKTNRVKVGGTFYGTKESVIDFSRDVMDYCRQTFWY